MQYFDSSIKLEHVFNRTKMPALTQCMLDFFNWLMVIINIIASLGCAVFGFCYHEFVGDWYRAIYACFMISGVAMLITAIVLVLAVCKIRSFLVDSGYGHRVNYRNFMLHALFFCMLILSLLFFYFGFALSAPTNGSSSSPTLLIVLNSIYILCQFLDQILLIVIFQRFTENVSDVPKILNNRKISNDDDSLSCQSFEKEEVVLDCVSKD